jgi:hypothetical protein
MSTTDLTPQAAETLATLRAVHGADLDSSVEWEGGERFLLAHLYAGKVFAETACTDLEHVRRYLEAMADLPDNPNPLPGLLIDLDAEPEDAVAPITYHPIHGLDLQTGYTMPADTSAADLEYEFDRVW